MLSRPDTVSDRVQRGKNNVIITSLDEEGLEWPQTATILKPIYYLVVCNSSSTCQ